MDAIPPDLIQAVARAYQGLDVSDERAHALANEVSGLNAGVRMAGEALRFADEPGDFARLLEEAAR